MLAFNVAGLMGSVPGTDRRYEINGAQLDLPDDLRLARPISGIVRLSRTSRSILADADLTTALQESCSRCLRPVVAAVHVELLEEALPTIDLHTGLPLDAGAEPDVLRIDDHHVLDLAVSVGEAISMAEPIAPLCRPDCRGLCPECGVDLNDDPAHEHPGEPMDGRLATLIDWHLTDTDPTTR
ncbi:MAG: YceD family protein [Candidatus Limnocylindrales bacterium]